MVIVDTGFWLALADQKDIYHLLAKRQTTISKPLSAPSLMLRGDRAITLRWKYSLFSRTLDPVDKNTLI
jgi:hypothetical protein